jgi:putative transposase
MTSRSSRKISPTGIYHWIVRGIHKKKIFHGREDFLYFKNLITTNKLDYQVNIYHYCLMDNHVHMLIFANDIANLSRFSQMLLRTYAYYYCKTYKWNGSVFKKRFKAIPIDKEVYLLECGRYIELNPVKAKIALKPEDYEFSSYHYYVKNLPDGLIESSPGFLGLSSDPVIRRRIYEQYVSAIRVEDRKERQLLQLV